ncbi:hypothetical protein M404DRAFT_1002073 [Pisolithus tinctorius Marx 270]|uniref:Uncharacterized protein n=1 Tax=Pisolithus tinctorius Marx 270 TaxID=870435 RepID=A0A0C3JZR5_PISTI|nr:hypothetical protein M404DRAFT_1002073 [Pisolithus tinctorius Marx 270]
MEDFDYSCNVQVGASALVESGEPPPTKSSPAKHRPSLPRWWSHPTYHDLRRPKSLTHNSVSSYANGLQCCRCRYLCVLVISGRRSYGI